MLAELVLRLRKADRWHRVFGASHHKYRLGKPLALAELTAFESSCGVRLPEDYRSFLLTVGNGGAGPKYGLEPLQSGRRDLSRPFPFTGATDEMSDEELDAYGGCDDYPGILELCHYGCNIYAYLVANGPTCGTIWVGREDFYPTGLSFSDWYRDWAEQSLQRLENLALVKKLRVGMSKIDVIGTTGGDWSERVTVGGVRYFEASQIPAQLELNEGGIVTKVKPWPSL
jgi:hypothetical protein